MPWTYILRCSDDSFYVGSTWDLDARMTQHVAGTAGSYTESRRPVELVWANECGRISDAYVLEKKIQGWRRAKKLALIEGRFTDLPALARTSRAEAPPNRLDA